jgi:hypothetical protein
MSLVVVAEPDLRERMRCTRIIAEQTPVSALGAANWHELEQVLNDAPSVELVFFSHGLTGAPEDALDQLLTRTKRLVLSAEEHQETPDKEGLTRVNRPIAEEVLVMTARALTTPSVVPAVSFVPVDFLQMICMSGGSHVLVLSGQSGDAGVIEVRDGEAWTAFDALGVGEEAFARLIRPEMRARVTQATGSMKERTLFKGLHELILESLRCIDEGRVLTPPPLSPSQLEATLSSPEELASRIQQLNADARRLLMLRNYDEAAGVLVRLSELDPASHLVRANLEQLRRLGYPK